MASHWNALASLSRNGPRLPSRYGCLAACTALFGCPAPEARPADIAATASTAEAALTAVRTEFGWRMLSPALQVRVLTSVAFAGDAVIASVPAEVFGCYDPAIGAWRPKLDLGRDAAFVRPPRSVALLPEPAGGIPGALLVQPAAGAAPSIHRWSMFGRTPSDSLYLTWTNGFSGVTVVLSATGDTLRGAAQTFWDFQRERQTAPASLVRRPC